MRYRCMSYSTGLAIKGYRVKSNAIGIRGCAYRVRSENHHLLPLQECELDARSED